MIRSLTRATVVCLVWQGSLLSAGAADLAPSGDPRILPAGARLEKLWDEGAFTEGVAVAPDGTICFSDIPGEEAPGKIFRFDPATGKTTVLCADSGKSNGLMFDRSGRLIAACGANIGKQALCEITPDGKVRVLVDRYRGKRFNSPNDLVIHPDGSVYFSDPRYVGPGTGRTRRDERLSLCARDRQGDPDEDRRHQAERPGALPERTGAVRC